MMIKNMMEEKQLDFNQPLLSVRRSSAPVVSSEAANRRNTDKPLPKLPPLPVYKSELKSGPVRNAGTVPFVWEQIPGRPKDERKTPDQAFELPPTTPKLPPGRASNVKKQASDKRSKRTTAAQSPAENVLSIFSQNVSNMDRERVTEYNSSKKGMEDKNITGSEDGDETYLDALEALSRTESFYMNCSVSGLSGVDGPDIKPSGTFSTDPFTRDFMMGRFLPAAKAMASETPQYSTRKQSAAQDQPASQQFPRGMKTVVSADQQRPLNQFRSNDLPRKVQDRAAPKSEDEGMRAQAQLPFSSVRRVHAKSYPSSYSKARNEYFGGDACGQRLMDGHQGAGVPEDKTDLPQETNQITNESDCQKLGGLPVYRRVQGVGISPYRNECSILHEEKGFLGIPEKTKNSRETSGSYEYRICQNNFRQLLATETADCGMGSGSPVVEKTLYVDSVHTVKSPSSNSRSIDTRGFIDYKGNDFEIPYKSHKVEETPSLESSFQDIEQLGDANEKAIVLSKSLEFPDSRFLFCSDILNKDVPADMRDGPRENQDLIRDCSNLASSKVACGEKFNLKSQQLEKSGDQESFDGLTQDCVPWTSPKLADEKKMDSEIQRSRNSGQEENLHGHAQNSITLTSSKVPNKERIDLENQRRVKLGIQKSARVYNSQLPLGPPLPKSPSESWLKRTLPAISSRNSSSNSSPGSRIFTSSQGFKTSSLDPKWETIVKTSNTHHGHLRFSEELLAPIPEV